MSSTHTESGPQPAARAGALAILLIACAGQFLVVLDVSVVNVALPAMRSGLGMSELGLQWVINAYVITFAGFMLLGGRAADVFGRKAVFALGLALFTAASLAGGLAQEPWQLVTARAVQGVGAAVLSPASLTILTTSFSAGALRTRAIGTWTAVGAGGGAAGSLVGGVLTDFLSWRWVLLINVPIGAVVLLAAARYLAVDADRVRRRLDLPGAVLVSAGLGLVAYGVTQTESAGWGSATALAPLLVGLAVLAAFVAVEHRAPAPLMPLGLLRVRAVAGANAAMIGCGAGMLTMWFFMTLYMQNVLGYSPLQTGLAFLPQSAAVVLGSKLAPRLMYRFDPKWLAVAGALIAAVGMGWQSTLHSGGSYVGTVLVPGLLMAFGAGLAATPLATAATSGAAAGDAGLVSGMINTSRQVGGALGLSVLAAVSASRIGGDTSTAALAGGYGLAFLVAAAILLGAALFMLVALPRDAHSDVGAPSRTAQPAARG